jgi:hypothetical protein
METMRTTCWSVIGTILTTLAATGAVQSFETKPMTQIIDNGAVKSYVRLDAQGNVSEINVVFSQPTTTLPQSVTITPQPQLPPIKLMTAATKIQPSSATYAVPYFERKPFLTQVDIQPIQTLNFAIQPAIYRP